MIQAILGALGALLLVGGVVGGLAAGWYELRTGKSAMAAALERVREVRSDEG
jgi:hypothetical protein